MKGFSSILTICLMLVQFAAAQQHIDARGAGMAFSNTADSRGLEQVGGNPATLALHYMRNFELNLLSGNFSAYNNSFDRFLYDQYFTTGARLGDAEKSELLNAIPDGGLQGNFAARMNTFAFYLPNFSLSVSGMGNGRFTLPREVAELGLNGNNELGRVYDFSNVDGQAWGGLSAALSFAVPLKRTSTSLLALGVTTKYLVGLGYASVMNSSGSLHNLSHDNPTVRLEGELEARTALGGTGFGMDFGLVAQTSKKLVFSASIMNVLGKVNWNIDPQMITYNVAGDSLGFTSDGFADSLLVEEDSSYTIDAFGTRMPVVLDFGIAYHPFKRLSLTAAYEQGVNRSMGQMKYSRLAFGFEYTGLRVIPLRSGISLGGPGGGSFAFGSGINFGFWYLDVSMINHGGLKASSSRGLTLAATTRFRF